LLEVVHEEISLWSVKGDGERREKARGGEQKTSHG
jgi:hypothetical protein